MEKGWGPAAVGSNFLEKCSGRWINPGSLGAELSFLSPCPAALLAPQHPWLGTAEPGGDSEVPKEHQAAATAHSAPSESWRLWSSTELKGERNPEKAEAWHTLLLQQQELTEPRASPAPGPAAAPSRAFPEQNPNRGIPRAEPNPCRWEQTTEARNVQNNQQKKKSLQKKIPAQSCKGESLAGK